MNINDVTLKKEERAIFSLKSLYSKYGYSQYKMSKFEEYDLYVRNKDFLISDSVITFTDTNGKLMALKPDVTLSIIKNGKDDAGFVQKVYYNENVYRVSKRTHSFKEIMQVGLECIGDIDDYCIFEVLMLAAESLKQISDDCVLDISHLGIISEIIDGFNVDSEIKERMIECIGQKNVHELKNICLYNGVSEENASMLTELISIYGKPDDVLPKLKEILPDLKPLKQLENTIKAFEEYDIKDILRIDFSVVSDMKYYNGFVFKGFVHGIPTGILSGGQYDKLMKKMGRKSGAIGFAVYLDMLENMSESDKKYDVDTVLLYDDNTDLDTLNQAIKMFIDSETTVSAQRKIPEKIRYKKLAKIENGEVKILEYNA